LPPEPAVLSHAAFERLCGASMVEIRQCFLARLAPRRLHSVD
jgi:hypothetical protein